MKFNLVKEPMCQIYQNSFQLIRVAQQALKKKKLNAQVSPPLKTSGNMKSRLQKDLPISSWVLYIQGGQLSLLNDKFNSKQSITPVPLPLPRPL